MVIYEYFEEFKIEYVKKYVCKGKFHIKDFYKFVMVNSTACEIGVDFTFAIKKLKNYCEKF